ncbi:MAG: DNA mismatch repair protein MutS, partial [Nitrospira sp.]|nr:DNA mismatch repair protein MutS [Nitrospira sp.]
MSETTLSPLMRQFRDIKQGYPDAILFFRVGDFYEMFYEDAVEASRLLSIALTSRDKNSPHPIPLCGIPYHSATGYIAKLLGAGRLVALCEQVEDPKSAKGLVKREVVRLYTPGTLVDTEFLIPGELNYLAAISVHPDADFGERIGLASLEVSTGEFWLMEFRGSQAVSQALNELSRLDPRELIFPTGLDSRSLQWIRQIAGPRLCGRPVAPFEPQRATQILTSHFHCNSLESLGCQGLPAALGAAGAVLDYFRETQPTVPLDHIRRLSIRGNNEIMHLDGTTIRNLELLKPLSAKEQTDVTGPVTLLSVLDHTVTAMGCRLLRQWLVMPLLRCELIEARLNAVEELKDSLFVRTSLRRALREVQDIARLGTRITLGLANPRELLALKQSLAALPEISAQLTLLHSQLLVESFETWDQAEDLYDLIERAIRPDAPLSLRDGNIIQEGYAPEIDELRKASKEGKEWIAALEGRERERTGIESLKVRYNQVFGYYIEITKANLARVPPDYIRKQTLVNAERF